MATADKVKEITELTNEFLRKDLEQLQNFLEAPRCIKRPAHLSEKIRGRKASLLILEGMTQKLPDSFEHFTYTPKNLGGEVLKTVRDQFNDVARRRFFKRVLESDHHNLKSMGLNEKHLETMQYGCVPRSGKVKKLDMSVDHLHELGDGGNHHHTNLCIMPMYLNLYKNSFTRIQVRAGLPEIISIRPKPIDNKCVFVPIIEGGFREATEDGPTIRRRMEQLLNMKLENV